MRMIAYCFGRTTNHQMLIKCVILLNGRFQQRTNLVQLLVAEYLNFFCNTFRWFQGSGNYSCVKKITINMRWHAELHCNGGRLMRHADFDAWKEFDKKHELFSSDPQKVRLGLATNGFNLFGSLSSKYSSWPIAHGLSLEWPTTCHQKCICSDLIWWCSSYFRP